MKSILQYGQAVKACKKNRDVGTICKKHFAAVQAIKDGYQLKDYERVFTGTCTIIRKRKGA